MNPSTVHTHRRTARSKTGMNISTRHARCSPGLQMLDEHVALVLRETVGAPSHHHPHPVRTRPWFLISEGFM